MARIVAVGTALPEYVSTQEEITELLAPMITADPARQSVLRRMHAAAYVRTRHTVLPLESYRDGMSFGASNDLFVREATRLGAAALADALGTAGLRADEIDLIVFTSVTGMSAPSVDALLVAELGMRDDVKRLPLFGLGCVAGAAGISRARDYLLGHPQDVAVLVSVELCSLTVQRGDDSMDNLVASGLFGDGAAAAVMLGNRRAARGAASGPTVVAGRSRLYPETREMIGFRPSETGLRVILTAGVVGTVDAHVPGDVRALLAEHGLTTDDVEVWVAHPGGPKVLEAVEQGLGLTRGELRRSWDSLAAVGNLSSASVLHILAAELSAPHSPGEVGMLFALGPGVSAEFVLLRW